LFFEVVRGSRYSIFKDYESVLKEISRLQNSQTDLRVLFLKLYVARALRRFDMVHETLQHILAIDPKNYRARHIILLLEEMEAKQPSDIK
jgi:transcription elongation factor GreA-like protein